MADYVAGRGTTALGVVGTTLGATALASILGTGNNGGGILGGLFGGGNGCNHDPTVSRYELGQEQTIAELRSQIALRDANTYSDQKLLALWEKIDGELKQIRQHSCDQWAAQGVINAKIDAAMATMNANIVSISSTLNAITRTAIPTSAICNFSGVSTGCCGATAAI